MLFYRCFRVFFFFSILFVFVFRLFIHSVDRCVLSFVCFVLYYTFVYIIWYGNCSSCVCVSVYTYALCVRGKFVQIR